MPNFNFNMFQGNKTKQVQKSYKDLSHEWKHDMTLGYLVPCLMIPTLPGDEFTIDSQFFFKCDPLYFPLIHRLNMVCDYYWVRNGAMWPAIYDGTPSDGGWENWIMMKSTDAHPTVDVDMEFYPSGTRNDSVMGYFGLPYLVAGQDRTTEITGLNAFPAYAYLMIYDQFHRHPQLEEPHCTFKLIAGDNTANMVEMYAYDIGATSDIRLSVFPAKWGKDYLTSCLPTPQVGDAVLIPSTKLDGDGNYIPQKLYELDGETPVAGTLEVSGDGDLFKAGASAQKVVLETNATICDLSIASVLQTLKEQLMKVGQRYKDWIDWSHDVDIDPLDINVPVMIGSYKGSIQISEVLTQANTTVGESTFITGDYAGNAGLYETGMNAIRFNCKDYGILMAIVTVTPNTGYGQGINRYWRYNDPLDYPMDIFTTIGDQEVRKEEAFFNNLELDKNNETFGYIPRYAEASFINNNYGTNLAFNAGLSVHLGKWYDPDSMVGTQYDDNIEINREFLRADATWQGGTRVSDVFKVLTFPNGGASMNPIYAYIFHNIKALRPLPQFSTPSL